jgi:hypothetical protein
MQSFRSTSLLSPKLNDALLCHRAFRTARLMREKPEKGLWPKFIYVYLINLRKLESEATQVYTELKACLTDPYSLQLCSLKFSP